MIIGKQSFNFHIVKSLSSARLPVLTERCCFYDTLAKKIHTCTLDKIYVVTSKSIVTNIFCIVVNDDSPDVKTKVDVSRRLLYPISEHIKLLKGLTFSKEYNADTFKMQCEYKSVNLPFMLKGTTFNGNSDTCEMLMTEFDRNLQVTNIYVCRSLGSEHKLINSEFHKIRDSVIDNLSCVSIL